MTAITKTNERDERKQISNALTSAESSISTIQSDISTIQGQITALEAGVNGSPPTSIKGIPTTLPGTAFDLLELAWITETTASTSTYDAWTTVLEETAAEGVIEFMAVYQVANASDRDIQARLTVDGVVVWTSSTTFWSVTGNNSFGAVLVGTYSGPTGSAYSATFGSCPFTTSFKLDFKKTENAVGTVEIGTRCRYYLTG